MYKVKEILEALDRITGNRCLKSLEDWTTGKNRWVIMKSSGIPGKSCLELPGLVWGDLNKEVQKLAVCMTLTESVIELAGAVGVDVVLSHHPACEAANSGGVSLSAYLDLYHLAYMELHEAFHGLHPGIPWLHGHIPFYTEVNYGGIVGNVVNVGRAVEEVRTIGNLLDRLNWLMDLRMDYHMLQVECRERNCSSIEESSVAARSRLLVGGRQSPVSQIIHIHPHCGITGEHLKELKKAFPESDTVVASISHVPPEHELVEVTKSLGMSLVCGNSHALEILENGVPLAYALKALLPELEIVIFRERQTCTSLEEFGTEQIRNYGRDIAKRYLKI